MSAVGGNIRTHQRITGKPNQYVMASVDKPENAQH